MAKDADYRRLIHTARWLRLRRDTLTAHPLCERCQVDGYVTPATEVHHVRPVEYGLNYAEKEALMFNHVKAHVEMGRSGKAATKRRNAEQVAGAIKRFFGDD